MHLPFPPFLLASLLFWAGAKPLPRPAGYKLPFATFAKDTVHCNIVKSETRNQSDGYQVIDTYIQCSNGSRMRLRSTEFLGRWV